MNSVIWKYTVNPVDINEDHEVEIEMPMDSIPLHAHEQMGHVCIWVDVPAGPHELQKKLFKVVPTGSQTDLSSFKYLGSAHLQGIHSSPDGRSLLPHALVFHIFGYVG